MQSSGVFRTTVDGIADIDRSLSDLIKSLEEKPTNILLEEAPRIEEEAKMRVPIKTGHLMSSIHAVVSVAKKDPGMRVRASAYNKGFNYALSQHEDFTYHHPNGGEAKFLETAFRNGVDRIGMRIFNEVDYDF